MAPSNSVVGETKFPKTKKKQPSGLLTKSSSDPDKQGVPIVGIGASAGGLEAFKSLLECLAIDTGFSFVVIQHLKSEGLEKAGWFPQILLAEHRF